MSKLRPIRTTRRFACVKRSAVTSAVRSVVVSRGSASGRFVVDRDPAYSRKSSAKKRK